MEDRKIIRRFPSGIITPPPSKSISHRTAICAWLASQGADRESVVLNMGDSGDIDATLSGVTTLGGRWHREGGTMRMLPASAKNAPCEIDCAESASTLRFLLPLAAMCGEGVEFSGSGRLMERPIDVYADVFAGAGVEFRRESGKVLVRGPIRSGVFHLPGNVSSQFVSGMLLALPLADGDSEIHLTTPLESGPYVDMTIEVMRWFGVEIVTDNSHRYCIRGGQRYCPATCSVEADYSQAAFFLASAALGRDVECAGLNPESTQGDREIISLLREMGASISWRDGILRVEAGRLRALTVDASDIPDLVPPVAALCCFCEGTSRIVNASRLRMKESDRLAVLARELTALGAQVEESRGGLTIHGSRSLTGGAVDAHGDHRIAMSLAVAAVRCEQPVDLTGAQSVRKSYPMFWDDFEKGERR